MYVDGNEMHLLDQADYNQYSLSLEEVEEERKYITEALEGMMALIYNDECVGVQLPAAVELTVTECDPTVKGDSATKRTKPATLETGLVVQVPEYLTKANGSRSTRAPGEFLSRALIRAASPGDGMAEAARRQLAIRGVGRPVAPTSLRRETARY